MSKLLKYMSTLIFTICVLLGLSANVAFAAVQGVAIHVINTPAAQAGTLDLMKSLGLTSFRVDAPWGQVEKVAGKYEIPPSWDQLVNLAVAHRIEPLLILDYGNPNYDNGDKPTSPSAVAAYVQYSKYVVEHFKGRVKYFELQNEWNNHLGHTTPGNTQDYARLVNATYPEIKKIDPSIVVLVGGGTEQSINDGWYDRLAALGALQNSDGISVHPYAYHGSVSGRMGPELSFAWIDALRSRLATKGINKPFYITEIGWPTNVGRFGISEPEAANYYERTVLLSQGTAWLAGTWWYDLSNDGLRQEEKEDNFGLTLRDGGAKSSSTRASAVNKFIATHKIQLLNMNPMKSPWMGVLATDGAANKTLVLWTTTGASLPVRIGCDYFKTGHIDQALRQAGTQNLLSVTISGTPTYLTQKSLKCE